MPVYMQCNVHMYIRMFSVPPHVGHFEILYMYMHVNMQIRTYVHTYV